jgi:hypothetical protein
MDLYEKFASAFDVEKVKALVEGQDTSGESQCVSIFWDDHQFGVTNLADINSESEGSVSASGESFQFGQVLRCRYGPQSHLAVFLTTGMYTILMFEVRCTCIHDVFTASVRPTRGHKELHVFARFSILQQSLTFRPPSWNFPDISPLTFDLEHSEISDWLDEM